jgi:hypothetical protein
MFLISFLVLETVLATLAGTHLAPTESPSRALRERWRKLYMAKDANSILRSQDACDCCGFRSPADMEFPFSRGQQGA